MPRNGTEMLEDHGRLAMTPPPAPSSPLYRLLRLHWCPLSGPTCRQWGLPPDASSHSAPGLPVSWRAQKQHFHNFNAVTQDVDVPTVSVGPLIISVSTKKNKNRIFKWHNHPKITVAKNILPNIVIGHDEGFAERLWRIEPHAGVLLHCCCELASDGGRAGVQGAGDGREQRFVWIRRSDSWPEQIRKTRFIEETWLWYKKGGWLC